MVSDRAAICRRQTLSRSLGTERPLPAADQRILLAFGGRPFGDRGPGDRSRLAQPPPGVDLGLFGTLPSVRRRRCAMTELMQPSAYRTIWISDLHLGTRGCKADFLLD